MNLRSPQRCIHNPQRLPERICDIKLPTAADGIILADEELAAGSIRGLYLRDPEVDVGGNVSMVDEVLECGFLVSGWIAGAVLVHVLRVRYS